MEHKAYLHRSGRTARAGAEGVVVTVALDAQRGEVKDLLRKASVGAALEPVSAQHASVSELVGEPAAHVTPVAQPVVTQRSGGRSSSGRSSEGGGSQNGRGGQRRGRSGQGGSGQGGSGQGNGGGAGSQQRHRSDQPAGTRQQPSGAKRHGQSGSASAPNSGSRPRFTTGSTVADIQRSARTPRRARG